MTHARDLQKLGRELAAGLDAAHDEQRVLPHARVRIEATIAGGAMPRKLPILSLGLAAVAIAAIAWLGWIRSPDAPSNAAAPASLVLTDGSTLQASPGARVRPPRDGAPAGEIVLEAGSLEGRASPGPWRVTAGPFEVVVASAAVRVTWDPPARALDVEVFSHAGNSPAISAPAGAGRVFVKTPSGEVDVPPGTRRRFSE